MCNPDPEDGCSLCAPEIERITSISASAQTNTTDHETFFKLVHKDGFSAIAEYFGRGILEPPERSPADFLALE